MNKMTNEDTFVFIERKESNEHYPKPKGPLNYVRMSFRRENAETCFTLPFKAELEAGLEKKIFIGYSKPYHAISIRNASRIKEFKPREFALRLPKGKERYAYASILIPDHHMKFESRSTDPKCKYIKILQGEIHIGLSEDVTVTIR